MKIEIDLHDSRKERPTHSCEVIVFHVNPYSTVFHIINTAYSAKHDQFSNYDSLTKAKKSYGEQDGEFLYWADFDDVAEAIRQAEVREGCENK